MQLLEIEQLLPNGLHDARITKIEIDYAAMQARFALKVWTGSSDCASEIETYRNALILANGLHYLLIEPPSPDSPFDQPGGSWLRYETTTTAEFPALASLLEALPRGSQRHSLFMQDWYSHLHFACDDLTFELVS